MDLTHHFLIAMPSIDDPFFSESVVYIWEHNADGATGIIINKPTPISMDIVFQVEENNMSKRFSEQFVMLGGPMQTDRGLVVHTPIGDWQSSLAVNDEIAITVSRDIVEYMIDEKNELKNFLLAIGYASWTSGQLEQELAENAWLTVHADQHILFELPSEKRYQAALAKLGIRPETLVSKAAYA